MAQAGPSFEMDSSEKVKKGTAGAGVLDADEARQAAEESLEAKKKRRDECVKKEDTKEKVPLLHPVLHIERPARGLQLMHSFAILPVPARSRPTSTWRCACAHSTGARRKAAPTASSFSRAWKATTPSITRARRSSKTHTSSAGRTCVPSCRAAPRASPTHGARCLTARWASDTGR